MKATLDHNQMILEARQEGEAIGEKRGLKQGRQETRIAMVIEMVQDGIDINYISKLSKLSIPEIEELKKNYLE